MEPSFMGNNERKNQRILKFLDVLLPGRRGCSQHVNRNKDEERTENQAELENISMKPSSHQL